VKDCLLLLLYAIVRLGLYSVFRDRSQAVIETRAQENSRFIETLLCGPCCRPRSAVSIAARQKPQFI
jgi:hypothetical protein